MTAKCSAIAKSGSRCQSAALPGSSFCLMHAPDMAEVRRAAGRKGGRNRANAERAKKALPEALTAEGLVAWLSALFMSTLGGKLDPKIANACASVARTLLEAQTAAAQPSVAELEEQVAVLRALIERQGHAA